MTSKIQKDYYYQGHKLYNVQKIKGMNICQFDIQANYMALPTLGHPEFYTEPNKEIEKLGKFYLKDLQIKEQIQQDSLDLPTN